MSTGWTYLCVEDPAAALRRVLDLCVREDEIRREVGDGSTPAVDTAAVYAAARGADAAPMLVQDLAPVLRSIVAAAHLMPGEQDAARGALWVDGFKAGRDAYADYLLRVARHDGTPTPPVVVAVGAPKPADEPDALADLAPASADVSFAGQRLVVEGGMVDLDAPCTWSPDCVFAANHVDNCRTRTGREIPVSAAEFAAQLAERRADPAFTERLRHRVTEDAALLRRLTGLEARLGDDDLDRLVRCRDALIRACPTCAPILADALNLDPGHPLRAGAVGPSLLARQPAPPLVTRPAEDNPPPLHITYRNHRGATGPRRIRPYAVSWATTEWHPGGPCWLLHAFDLDRQAERSFAFADILHIGPTPLGGAAAGQPAAWMDFPLTRIANIALGLRGCPAKAVDELAEALLHNPAQLFGVAANYAENCPDFGAREVARMVIAVADPPMVSERAGRGSAG